MGWGALDKGVCLCSGSYTEALQDAGEAGHGQVSEWEAAGVCGTTGDRLGGHGAGMDRKVIRALHATGLAGPGVTESGREQRPGWWSGCLLRERVEGVSTPSPGRRRRGGVGRGESRCCHAGFRGTWGVPRDAGQTGDGGPDSGGKQDWCPDAGAVGGQLRMKPPESGGACGVRREGPGLGVWRPPTCRGFSLEKVLRVMRLRKTKQLFHDL